ncbi:MAG: cysteine--tRNA ligase [Lachnospiraceae bacterium]|nr:cysteine--tRNA ligase [Lachnospiraceae bacterium]
MKIYNTLTRRKEELKPLNPGKITMYVCGPTVYSFIHIGNARPMVVFDTVRKYLEYKGYDVNFVSNFTDVDDKIIKKAIEEGVDSSVISERYIAEYYKDAESLNVKDATTRPRATREIDGMIAMIQELIDKGHAYEKNGTVYFSTQSFEEYGKLSGKNLDELFAGARIAVSDEKQDPSDFVLWKPKKEGEPFWVSPWSEGRPGWHIECSVMSKKYLGEEIDIHAGGVDLIFPHHENEIAQTESCTGKPFAKYWMHNAFVTIDNIKMSKSLGNFLNVRDILKEYTGPELRFFILNVHYRSPINFSREIMESAKNGLERIRNGRSNLDYILENAKEEALKEGEAELKTKFDEIVNRFEEVMEDDFNTADAITCVYDMVKLANTELSATNSKEMISYAQNRMDLLLDILGVVVKEDKSLEAEIQEMIDKRQQARKNKDFALADKIRDELLAKGIVLLDTREGVKWKKA